MKGHFAYMSGYLICGGCGNTLSSYIPPTPLDEEYTYRVYCSWRECPCYLQVFEPTDKIKVGLIPTKLRAGEAPGNPNTIPATAGTTAVAGGYAGIAGERVVVNVDAPRDWARLRIPETPTYDRIHAETVRLIETARLMNETPRLVYEEVRNPWEEPVITNAPRPR